MQIFKRFPQISTKKLIIIAAIILITAVAIPAFAITDGGELDGEDHPYVGLMIAYSGGGPAWRCSGALISPTLYLTAGHCTDGAEHVEIWFDSDVESGIPANGYPFTGNVSGTAYTHPSYNPNAFFLYDLGMVVLDEPVILDEYATYNTDVGALNDLPRGKRAKFTAVGYGLQAINPVFVEAERVRMQAHPHLVMINVPGFTGDFSIMLSNNHSTGGTCYGDSGGPNLLGDSNVIAGVTSFGINDCTGVGGVYRIDQQDDIDFINSFFD